MPAPRIGQNVGGYIYQGGDPNSPSSWTQAGGAPARPARGGGRGATGPTTSSQTGQQLRAAQESAASGQRELAQVGNFQELNRTHSSGGLYGLPWLGERLVAVQAPFDPALAQMQAITAQMTPAQRVPGSGSTSDFEQRLFGQAVPSVRQPRAANDAMINNARDEVMRRQARSAFFDQYAQQNGNLIGAEAQFETFWAHNQNLLTQLHQIASQSHAPPMDHSQPPPAPQAPPPPAAPHPAPGHVLTYNPATGRLE